MNTYNVGVNVESVDQKALLPAVVPLLTVGLGGIAGSALRWLVSTSIGPDNQMWSIFVLNVAGSLLLGVLVAHPARSNSNLALLLGVGFAGGLTTFSTFAVDIAQHLDEGTIGTAVINGTGTTAFALLAAGIGYRLGRSSL